MAKPPLSRQIWIIRRRSYISNRRCSLRIAVGKQNTPDNITVLYFHLLADVFLYLLRPQVAFEPFSFAIIGWIQA